MRKSWRQPSQGVRATATCRATVPSPPRQVSWRGVVLVPYLAVRGLWDPPGLPWRQGWAPGLLPSQRSLPHPWPCPLLCPLPLTHRWPPRPVQGPGATCRLRAHLALSLASRPLSPPPSFSPSPLPSPLLRFNFPVSPPDVPCPDPSALTADDGHCGHFPRCPQEEVRPPLCGAGAGAGDTPPGERREERLAEGPGSGLWGQLSAPQAWSSGREYRAPEGAPDPLQLQLPTPTPRRAPWS